MSNLRKIALNALIKVDEGGFSTIVLDNALNESELNDNDKALASNIFYGVCERKLTLEFYLNKYLKKPVNKLPNFVRFALLIGAYQIIYLEKIPSFAAVNESVNLVAKSKFSGFKSLVNAVLRNLERNGTEEIDENNLSVKYSVDESIANALVNDYSLPVAKDILNSALMRPDIYVRKNILKEGEIKGEKTDLENCYIIKGAVEKTQGYKEGVFYVQDKSSQLCCAFLNAQKTDDVLDVCAAPGGKSFTISQNAKSVTSCDIHPHRVELIKKGANRLGIKNITTIVNDAQKFNEKLPLFDKVLCDVPCSGIGVMRRKPDIKYKKIDDLDSLCRVQYNILQTSSRYLKQSGEIVYSTCTLLKRENEDIVNKFLSENKQFSLVEMKTLLPCENVTDGFFMAKMIRR